jgi:alpha-beta hydrolase superfamily lysophospholipase
MKKLAAAALAFGTLALSADLLGQAQYARPTLPAPVGPFAVGRIDYHWTDISRSEPHSAENSARREVMVHVWYPAEPPKGAGMSAPYFADFMAVKKVVTRETLEALFRPARYAMIDLAGLPETHALEIAAMPKASVKYPVLVFSHGLGNPSSLYTAALEDLASHGYVVAAIEHTFDSAFTIFPGGRIVTYARDAWNAETQKPGGYVNYVKTRIEEMWAPDIRFVISELSRHNAVQSLKAPFVGRLDLQRVGALGHSMGGLAAVRACQLDSRITACMNQDADIAGSPFVRSSPDEPLRKPLLFFTAATANVFKGSFMHPTDEALASMRTTRTQYDADVRRVQMNQNNALAGTEAPSYRVLIDRPSFVHRSFSDLTLLAAYNEPKTSADAALDFEIAESFTRAFFDKHLKNAPNTLLERAAAPYEGVRVDRFGVR